jgi:ketosteroid isomerase-like protein
MRLPLVCLLALSVASIAHAETREQLTQQVRDAENAFAATMAARDHKAFATFIAEDSVFFGSKVLRGKAAVVEGWNRLYE